MHHHEGQRKLINGMQPVAVEELLAEANREFDGFPVEERHESPSGQILRFFAFIELAQDFGHEAGDFEVLVRESEFLEVVWSCVLVLSKLILENPSNIGFKACLLRFYPVCFDQLSSNLKVFRTLTHLAGHCK